MFRLSIIIKLTIVLFMASIALKGYSQMLEPKWESCFGGTEWDQGNSIIKNNSGYLILGSTESSDGDIQGHHGLSDSWLIQVDTVGNILWTKCYGGTKGEYGEEILDAGNNQYYLTGIGGSENGDISFDPYPNSMDYWIVKIDSIGDIIWDRILGGNKIDWTRNARVVNDGGVIALGITTSDDGDITNPNGSWDLWMIKLNSNGEFEWDFSLGGEGSEGGGSLMQTSDGGIIVIGNTSGVGGGNYDTTCNFHGNPGGGFVDAWIVKLDSLRNIEWQQCYGGTYHDFGLNAIETSDGYVILGYTLSNDGDVSGNHSGGGPISNYGGDIWVFKIDKQGNLLWQNCLGGLYDDFARNIFHTSDSGFMIVGTTQSDDGDVEGFNGFEPGGYDDVWLAKLDSTGNLVWQYCYGGEDQELLYRGVVQKSDYNYVITLGTYTYDWKCSGYVWPPDLRIVELYDTTVGIAENKTQNLSVEVFPNPATERINFTYSLPAGNTSGKLSIFNSSGKLVHSFNLMAMQGQVVYNTSTLPNGVYLYTVMSEGKKETGKFVVVR